MLLTKHRLQVLEWWECARFLQSERLYQGGQDQVGILNGSKRDEADAIGEAPLYLGRDCNSQTRLAHPSRASQGEQTHLWTCEQGTDCRNLPLPPDERGERQGQDGETPVLVRRGSMRDGWLIRGRDRLSVREWSTPVRPLCLGVHLLLPLSEQLPSYGVQSLQGHLLHLAHIDAMELPIALAVGAPVPGAVSMARLLAAHGKGSKRTAHPEEGGGL